MPGQQTLVWVGVRARAWRAGGASPLNGGDGTAGGQQGQRESGEHPQGGGWGAPPGVQRGEEQPALPVALRPASGSALSSQHLSPGPASLPPCHGGQWGEGLTHDDLGLSPAPSEWGPQGRPGLQAGSLQTALSPTAGALPARPPLRQRVSPPPCSPVSCSWLPLVTCPGEELAESRCMWGGGPGGSLWKLERSCCGLWAPQGRSWRGCPTAQGSRNPLGSSQKCEPARLRASCPR